MQDMLLSTTEFEISQDELQLNNNGFASFPHSERWVAELASLSWNALNRLLRIHNFPSVGQKIVNELQSLSENQWVRRMTSPEIFAWCTESQKKENLGEDDWLNLQAELDYDPDPVSLHPNSTLVVWQRPSSVMLKRLKLAGAGSLGETSRYANFIPASRDDFTFYLSRICEAMQIIAEVTPGYLCDINQFLRALALADSGASFRGSSSLGRFGLVWFAPRYTWTPYIWAEEIVHECTHNLIDAVGAKDPLLLGDNLEASIYYSPLRLDARPIGMIFHALCVVSRVLTFLDRLEETGNTYPDLSMRRDELRYKSRQSLQELDTHANPSPMGRAIIEQMIRPTILG